MSVWVRLGALVAVAAGMAALAGCAPLALGGIAASTAVVGSEDRGFSGFASDARIQSDISKAWFDHSLEMSKRLDVTVNEGRVLLTGRAKDVQMRLDAVRLAWQPDGVREVINEVQIDNDSGIVTDARDLWISTQLRGRLTFDKNIKSQNYSIDTVNGVVYLMGIAQGPQELDRVIEHARTLAGVQRVVNHVRTKRGT